MYDCLSIFVCVWKIQYELKGNRRGPWEIGRERGIINAPNACDPVLPWDEAPQSVSESWVRTTLIQPRTAGHLPGSFTAVSLGALGSE
jgi:hypothetical protein